MKKDSATIGVVDLPTSGFVVDWNHPAGIGLTVHHYPAEEEIQLIDPEIDVLPSHRLTRQASNCISQQTVCCGGSCFMTAKGNILDNQEFAKGLIEQVQHLRNTGQHQQADEVVDWIRKLGDDVAQIAPGMTYHQRQTLAKIVVVA